MSDLTDLKPLPEAIQKYYKCKLLHSRMPARVRYWDEEKGEAVYKIVMVCKEGCDELPQQVYEAFEILAGLK